MNLAEYKFENNGNDTLSVYVLGTFGAGPVFQTDQTYEGAYSYSCQNQDNFYGFSPELIADLGSRTQWNIDYWVWTPGTLTAAKWYGISSNWTELSCFVRGISGSALSYAFLMYNGAEISTSGVGGTSLRWNRVSCQWRGAGGTAGTASVWVNGTKMVQLSSGTNIFALKPTGTYRLFSTAPPYYVGATEGRMDKMIIGDTALDGVEPQFTQSGAVNVGYYKFPKSAFCGKGLGGAI